MTAKMRACVGFARFCVDHGVDPADLAELMGLAGRAAAAGERAAGSDDERIDRASERATRKFEEKANSLGFAVMWPGLYPALVKGGPMIHLPEL